MPEPVEKMRGLEWLCAIEPGALDKFLRPGQAAGPQGLGDDLERGHPEPAMLGAEPFGESRNAPRGSSGTRHRAAHRPVHLQEGVGAGGVDVVMFEERRRRQHDVGHRRGLGHELLVHADEQVVAREALMHQPRFRATRPSGWCSG